MWKRISLRGRIYTILTTLVLITSLGAIIMVWYSFRMETVLTSMINRNLIAYETAEALETALINQKGFVTYYFLDGDPDWLKQLGEYRQIFKDQLNKALTFIDDPKQKDAINQIDSEYHAYVDIKDRVIDFYKAGKRRAGSELHPKARERFFRILALCENFKDIQKKGILSSRQNINNQAKKSRIIAGTTILINLLLVILLAFVLINQILGPVRKLSIEADRGSAYQGTDNEIQALRHRLYGLIDEIDQTQSELTKSREHLLQAEKMALVGKLAAGMAHSIRNPFTSVKMRLFSLERSLNLTETQKDDLKVISEEIRHIDTIVQNFLEFSRPPKLKMQQISPSTVVDLALQLLEHRLKSYDASIDVVRHYPLPDIQADPEQLKEVIVNLVVNSCEAMEKGGKITIQEEAFLESPKKVAVIRLTDTGPGIPATIIDKIFQPFFTTKEEGTGLGLSIAARIVEEHHGRLEVTSTEGGGATFIITLPLMELDLG